MELTMTEMNFTLTPVKHHAGWELKYATKSSIQYKNLSLGKIIELSKHSIQNHRWRVSVFNEDRSIDDTDKLKKTEAFGLAHTSMNT